MFVRRFLPIVVFVLLGHQAHAGLIKWVKDCGDWFSIELAINKAGDSAIRASTVAAAEAFKEDVSAPLKESDEFKIEQELAGFDREIRNSQDFAGSVEKTTTTNIRRRMRFLRYYMDNGQLGPSIGMYKSLFFDVENAFWKIREATEKINTIKLKVANGEILPKVGDHMISMIKRKYSEFYVTYGEKSFEYELVRKFLEKTIEEDKAQDPERLVEVSLEAMMPKSMNASANMVKEDAPMTEAEKAKRILHGVRVPALPARPPVEEFEKLYAANGEARIAKLKMDKREQRKTKRKSWIRTYTLFNAAQKAVYLVPPKFRTAVSMFFQMDYKDYLRDTYLPDIEAIIRNPDPTKRLGQLIQLNGRSSKKDELLIAFYCFITGASNGTNDVTSDYSNLRAEVQAFELNGRNDAVKERYKKFGARMDAAAKAGDEVGDLSNFYDIRGSERFTVTTMGLGAMGIGAAWQVHAHWPEIQSILQHALQVLHQIQIP